MSDRVISPASEVKRGIPVLPASPERLESAVAHLRNAASPVEVISDRRNHLIVRYDAANMDIRDVERLLNQAGIQCSANVWWRVRSAWYRFLDDNVRSNFASSGGACCNRPPSLWRGIRRTERKR